MRLMAALILALASFGVNAQVKCDAHLTTSAHVNLERADGKAYNALHPSIDCSMPGVLGGTAAAGVYINSFGYASPYIGLQYKVRGNVYLDVGVASYWKDPGLGLMPIGKVTYKLDDKHSVWGAPVLQERNGEKHLGAVIGFSRRF